MRRHKERIKRLPSVPLVCLPYAFEIERVDAESTRDGTKGRTMKTQQRHLPFSGRARLYTALFATLGLAVGVPVWMNQSPGAVGAAAVVPTLPSSTQFDVTGFLQSATLDQACVTAAGRASTRTATRRWPTAAAR